MHISRSLNNPRAVRALRESYDRRGVLVVDDAFAGPSITRLHGAATEIDRRGLPWKLRFKASHYSYSHLRSCELQERLGDPLPAGSHLCDLLEEKLGCSLCKVARALHTEAVSAWCSRVTRTEIQPHLTLMLSRYGSGSFLAPHDDASAGFAYQLAFILYLNPSWDPTWGGALRVRSKEGWETVQPIANRLVLFAPTSQTPHEVEPVFGDTPRFAVSGWYLGDGL